MSKTRHITGIGALVLAVTFAASVPAIRRHWMEDIDRQYRERGAFSTLYRARIKVMDATTSLPLDFQLAWDHESISPWSKGSAATVIEKNGDGSQTLIAVGKDLPLGLPVTVKAKGYREAELLLKGQSSGALTTQPSERSPLEVKLERDEIKR